MVKYCSRFEKKPDDFKVVGFANRKGNTPHDDFESILLSIGTALDWNEVRWVDIVQSEPLPQIFITLV